MKLLFPAALLLGAVPFATSGLSAQMAETAPLTLDSSIETLMADAEAREIVLATLPDLDSAPGYDQFKVVSLRKLQPHTNGLITEEHLTTIGAGLRGLNDK